MDAPRHCVALLSAFYRRSALWLACVVVGCAVFSIASAAPLKVPATYPTIQAAINAWKQGDVIWVAQGTYTENLRLKPGVRLEGGYKADYSARNWNAWPSVVDGAQQGSVVIGADEATLDGFTLRNGKAAMGGGVLLERASMTIKNNTIEDNVADNGGGGIYIGFNPPAPPYTDIESNVIRRNQVVTDRGGMGGGILISNSSAGVRITRNVIGGSMGNGNSAVAGGGGISVEFTSLFQIEENTISHNTGGRFHGGGVIITDGTPNATLSRNTITFNSVQGNFGGGVYSIGGTFISRNNVAFNSIFNTIAYGGGIAVDSPGGTPPRLENNFVHNNDATFGAGIYIVRGQDVILTNNSIASNRPDAPQAGAGVYVKTGATCILLNNVIWGNGDDFHEQSPGACRLDHNDIEDGDQAGQNGNISANPAFVAYDNLHIQKSSPAINAGNPAAAPALDFDGDKRGKAIDIGADEVVSEQEQPCPLARSARASYLERHLGAVRSFRDTHLMTNVPGQAAVSWYYQHAPAASAFLEQHDWARHLTRWIATPAVLAIAFPDLALLALLALAAPAIYRRRRAKRVAFESKGDRP